MKVSKDRGERKGRKRERRVQEGGGEGGEERELEKTFGGKSANRMETYPM